jgi:fumarate hydratase class II
MPGKVNHIQCEAGRFGCMATRPRLRSVAARGIFELNVFKPVIIRKFLHSVTPLTDVSGSFLHHCLTGSNAGRSKLPVPAVRS